VLSQASERPDGEMEQDGLKSRNHKMVLAPSRSLSAMHFPSWRTRQQSAFATHSVADRFVACTSPTCCSSFSRALLLLHTQAA
jgi:hypothetical protein